MRRATTGLAAALCCASLLPGWPAQAQLDSREAISLQNQILELRHEIQQGGAARGGGDAAAPMAPPIGGEAPPASQDATTGLTPQLLTRVSTLEEEVRTLRGQVDQLTNQVQQQNAALSKQIGDLGFAVQQAHAEPAAAPSPMPHQAPAPAHHRTAQSALHDGDDALARRNYAAAETDARAAMAAPGSDASQATHARFLLAQSYAGQRNFQRAATAYYDTYSHAPHSSQAPDALLGVASSLLALGDKSDACQALQKLHTENAAPSPHIRKASASLRARADCR